MADPVDKIGPDILDGVEDQAGNRWLLLGTASRSVWVPLIAVGTLSGNVLVGLQKVGFSLLAQNSKEAFKKRVEAFDRYRTVPIASRPGWAGDTYIHADGSKYGLRGSADETIVAFERDLRFSPMGSLKDWQEALAPLIRDQPLPLVLMSFAFVGPLLRFMPPDVQNPIVEIVGPRERGKSSLVYAASAIAGGDPSNRMGIARSWNFSPQKLDEIRAAFADGLLVLDEANLAGRTPREKAEQIGSAVFRLADTAPRERFGEAPSLQVRQAVVSTSNVALRDLVGSDTDVQAAIVSRVLTLNADRPFGIFDTLPAGLTGEEAAEALMNESARFTGTTAHAFSRELGKRDPGIIARGVEKGMRRATAFFVSRGLSPRHAKILATAPLSRAASPSS